MKSGTRDFASLVNWAVRQRVIGAASTRECRPATCGCEVLRPETGNARVKVTWSRMAAVLALKGVVERGPGRTMPFSCWLCVAVPSQSLAESRSCHGRPWNG